MVNTTTKASSYGNNGIEDIVQTTAGGIPFSAVYHLRIDPSWNNQSGSRVRRITEPYRDLF